MLDLYAGRSSDQQITIDCGILNLMENRDSIMADKGFDIEHNLASVRIHVEWAIARVNKFKILSTVFPGKAR